MAYGIGPPSPCSRQGPKPPTPEATPAATAAEMSSLILKRATVSRPSGQWSDDDHDVLENGVVVGRIFLSPGAPQHRQWMWASGHNGEIRRTQARKISRTTHGYREAAMAAFAKSWRRE
jgi:hypothetical protein